MNQTGGQSESAYDLVGNILSKGDYATGYLYGSATRASGKAGPHAVRQVSRVGGGATLFTYDDNGNLLTGDAYDSSWNLLAGDRRTIDYDLMDRATKITQGTGSAEFKYAPDGARYRQVVTTGDTGRGPRTVHYLDKDYELTVWGAPGTSGSQLVEKRSYLGPVVVLWKGSTTTPFTREERYPHVDHLGSVDAVTDAAGVEYADANGRVDSHGYDAFGAPRARDLKGSDDKLHPYGEKYVTSTRGFTGHEHLDVVSIIHMNGRVYDYRLGRFLSVDPFISNPLSSQAINPYSYIGNNPLSGTDPTGYIPKAWGAYQPELKGVDPTHPASHGGMGAGPGLLGASRASGGQGQGSSQATRDPARQGDAAETARGEPAPLKQASPTARKMVGEFVDAINATELDVSEKRLEVWQAIANQQAVERAGAGNVQVADARIAIALVAGVGGALIEGAADGWQPKKMALAFWRTTLSTAGGLYGGAWGAAMAATVANRAEAWLEKRSNPDGFVDNKPRYITEVVVSAATNGLGGALTPVLRRLSPLQEGLVTGSVEMCSMCIGEAASRGVPDPSR